MNYKLAYLKQKEIIEFYEERLSMGEIHSAFTLKSELSLLEKEEEIEEKHNPTACDVCGRHPAVIIVNEFGTFCKEHAKYI